jgi:hypothetical protein
MMPDIGKQQPPNQHKQIQPEHLASYQVIASRRLGYDTLMWQTPMLGLTAQAFLFSSALTPSESRTARLIAMCLALATSIISMQLMSKHRHHELADSLLLERFEMEHKLVALHARPDHRDVSLHVRRPWYIRLSSYRVWMAGLSLFAIAAAAIIVITIAYPSLLQ